jgi:hypothetical protein
MFVVLAKVTTSAALTSMGKPSKLPDAHLLSKEVEQLDRRVASQVGALGSHVTSE